MAAIRSAHVTRRLWQQGEEQAPRCVGSYDIKQGGQGGGGSCILNRARLLPMLLLTLPHPRPLRNPA